MLKEFCVASLSCLFLLAGCSKRSTILPSSAERTVPSIETKVDACTLITNDEVQAIQGSPIKETKGSATAGGGFRVSQCFYTAAEFSKSVSLTLTQSDPEHSTGRTPKDYWKKTFGDRAENEEGEAKASGAQRGEEEERRAAPRKIDGVGDEAYWTGIRFGGALYVLKKDRFIRISVGGGDTEESKINKSKALALKAVERLDLTKL